MSRDKCCQKTVLAHCEGCPHIPVERCPCFRCKAASEPAPASAPSAAEMAAFGASEYACTLYPGEDQAAERAAFCEGAARTARTQPCQCGELREALEAAHEHMHQLCAILPGHDQAYGNNVVIMTDIRRVLAATAPRSGESHE